MKFISIFLFLQAVLLAGIPQTIVRGFSSLNNQEVTLDDDLVGTGDFAALGGTGLPGRTSDHATVAMNSNRDIVVAFHSDRNDIALEMKQVEVAFYEFMNNDTWEHRETKIVGCVGYSPITAIQQTNVKCERPDIVAVDDLFFVVWTRRYVEDPADPIESENEPAVLECAWIEIIPGSGVPVACPHLPYS